MNIKDYECIIHLSHNDLDGYSCQYLTKQLKDINTKYFNTSYFDVSKNLNLIFNDLLNVEFYKDKKTLVLITDVNLDQKTEEKIIDFKNGNQNLNFDLLVIDHHKTGLDVANRNKDWYKLDTSRCATYLVGQWIIDNFDISESKKKYIEFIMDFVDSHDRWLEDHKFHHKANLVSGFLFNKLEYPEIFRGYQREHFFYFLRESFRYFSDENNNIYDFENNQTQLLLSFLKDKLDKDFYENKNICYDHKLFKYFTNIYLNQKTDTFEVKYDENTNYKFKLFYELDSNVYQYLSHYYLNDNSDKIDFMLNMKSKGSMSFRSKGDIDVGGLANKYFNGGGHTNAAGGSIPLEKDVRLRSLSDVIELLKTQVNIINLEEIESEIKQLDI